MSSTCISLKVPPEEAPRTRSRSPTSVVVWREPATGARPLTAALLHVIASVSKMCRSACERRPSWPPKMYSFRVWSAFDSTRVAVWPKRGSGGSPPTFRMYHVSVSVSRMRSLPPPTPPKTTMFVPSAVAEWRERGDGSVPWTTGLSIRLPTWSVHVVERDRLVAAGEDVQVHPDEHHGVAVQQRAPRPGLRPSRVQHRLGVDDVAAAAARRRRHAAAAEPPLAPRPAAFPPCPSSPAGTCRAALRRRRVVRADQLGASPDQLLVLVVPWQFYLFVPRRPVDGNFSE